MLTVMVAAAAGGYLALCAALFLLQRPVIFPAPRARASAPPGMAYVAVPGGTSLAWSDAGGDGPVLVHFHGNAEQAADSAFLAARLVREGVSFAAVEYPGYAGTPGAPTEASLLDAAARALEHLAGPMGVARGRLALSGQSLGTGVAVAMAARGWGTRLLLVSPYTSLADVGARAFPWVPVRLLLRDRLDSAARAPEVRVPALVLHGTLDEVIPFDLGRALAARLPGARFVALEGAGHNDVWGAPAALPEVLRLLRGP